MIIVYKHNKNIDFDRHLYLVPSRDCWIVAILGYVRILFCLRLRPTCKRRLHLRLHLRLRLRRRVN